jgi:hypothetical protein
MMPNITSPYAIVKRDDLLALTFICSSCKRVHAASVVPAEPDHLWLKFLQDATQET